MMRYKQPARRRPYNNDEPEPLRAFTARRGAAGFTLLELMIALAIPAILVAVAVPGFKRMVRTNRRAADTNALVYVLRLARSQAINRNAYVTVCMTKDGRQCDENGRAWDEGWLAFINRNRDYPPKRDAEERILAVHGRLRAERLRGNRNAFTFRPRGIRSTNGTFVFCGSDAATERAVIVSYTGRVRLGRPDSVSVPPGC